MKGRQRIGLAALVAALVLIVVPSALAGGTDVLLSPQGGGSGFVTGTVNSVGAFNCFWTGSAEVGDCAEIGLALNDVVVLTASASFGSTFGGWDGTCIGTIGPPNVCTFTVLLGTPASVVVEAALRHEPDADGYQDRKRQRHGPERIRWHQLRNDVCGHGTGRNDVRPDGHALSGLGLHRLDRLHERQRAGSVPGDAQPEHEVTANFNSLSVLTVSVVGTGNVTSSPAGSIAGTAARPVPRTWRTASA